MTTANIPRYVPPGAKIRVIGVGGGGGNAINTMIKSNLDGVEFIAGNTDVQALQFSLAQKKLQLGKELTKGLGAGADPDIGRDAALEDRHEILEALAGADMVFITAGMGGGTGTGGASVIAQIARELGALTVAVVTKPFNFEGKRRRVHAEIGIERLREHVDTLITIPNQRLLQIATPSLTMVEAFALADEVLVNAVRGISDIINVPGTINVDFADVKTVMSCMGQALMGIGSAAGESRAVEAARAAISSPLLEDVDIEGATGILINITAGPGITLMEVDEACSVIQEAAHEDANIIFGAVIDESMGQNIRVTVIATGFPVETTNHETRMRGDYPEVPYKKRPGPPVKSPSASAASLARQSRTIPMVNSNPLFTGPQKSTSDIRVGNGPGLLDPALGAAIAAGTAALAIEMTAPAGPPSEAASLTEMTLDYETVPTTPAPTPGPLSSRHEHPSMHPGRDRPALGSSSILDLGDYHPNEGSMHDNRVIAATLDKHFQDLMPGLRSGAEVARDVARSIDEALHVIDKAVPTADMPPNDDMLDVPAFLRNGMKDLPLR